MKFNQREHLKRIGRRGALARMKLYGNPGTTEGRSLGGKRSIQSHRHLRFSPFVARRFSLPPFSGNLSEFIGILLGDGGVTTRQVTVTLNSHDDKDYANYVTSLVKKVFGLSAIPRERVSKNVNNIVISRTLLVEFLKSVGMTVGSKVRNQAGVPDWIEADLDYKKRCLRGLFDTDGCFYVDKHIIKNKIYKNPGMNFTNRSMPLLFFFKDTLARIGLRPTQNSKYSIVLRRESDIVRYFSEIGSSNPKHLNKFRAYLQEKGRVPKWS